MIPEGSNTPVVLASGIVNPSGVTIDRTDNLYYAAWGNQSIQKIAPTGGYFINPALPAGLVFNSATGLISGTPTMECPATNYTVTAYNSLGASTAFVIITVNKLPAPKISYSGPQTYTVNAPITPLAPAGSGGTALAYSMHVPLSFQFSNPQAIAADVAGNVYVAENYLKNDIMEIPVGGAYAERIASGLKEPYGVTIDALGNIFVAEGSINAIMEIPAGGGSRLTIASGLNVPNGVAVDAAGNVYVADEDSGLFYKIRVGGSPAVIASGVDSPSIAVDAAGDVYFPDVPNNLVREIPAGGGRPITIAPGFNIPFGVILDASGNVYVADNSNNAIKKIPAGGGSPVTIATGLNHPQGIAVDGAGIIYVTEDSNPVVKKIIPLGGYFINKALPAGLSINNSTGTISGTSTAASPATTYTITA